MNDRATPKTATGITKPPTGLAVFALVGLAFVWCGYFIGGVISQWADQSTG